MAGWTTSTQRNRWTFTPDQLAEQRRTTNNSAAEALKAQLAAQEQQQPQAQAGVSNPGNGSGTDGDNGGKRKRAREGAAGGVEPLSAEEERELCRYYEWKIVEVCRAFQFKPKIQSTAMHYFKRFFLRHSVMEQWEPKSIMLTVVYIACKIDEAYVSAEALGHGIKQDPKLVLSNEMAVLEALDFDLICHGPHKPLLGFLLDWRDKDLTLFDSLGSSVPPDFSSVEALELQALAQLPSLMTTDAPLLYPPSALSLAALTLALNSPAAPAHLLSSWKEYMRGLAQRQGQGQGQGSLEAVEETVQRILDLVQAEGGQVDEGRVKHVNRKLNFCKNPSLWHDEMKRKKEKKEQSKPKKPSAVP